MRERERKWERKKLALLLIVMIESPYRHKRCVLPL